MADCERTRLKYSGINRVMLTTIFCLWMPALKAQVVADAGSGTAEPASSTIQSNDNQMVPATDEIVVTAQKRAQNVQDVPATVSVLGGAMIADYGISRLDDINAFIPGFALERTAGGNVTLSIRGVGTTSSGQSLEQSVATYIDGVYGGGNQRDYALPLYDIARIEVVKGTQSGISGQNTSVGAVNIVTNKPGSLFGGYLQGGREFEHGGWNLEGGVDLPVSNTFGVRLAGFYEDVGGYLNNLATGRKIGGRETASGRVNAVWTPDDRLKVSLYAQYDDTKAVGNPQFASIDPNNTIPTFETRFPFRPLTDDVFRFSSRSTNGGDDGYEYHSVRGSLTVEYDLGAGYTLTSISAGSRTKDHLSVDLDFITLDSTWLEQRYKYWQATEELRIASPTTQPLNFIAGLWYRHARFDKVFEVFLDDQGSPLFQATIPYDQKTDTFSAFEDAQYKISEQFSIGGSLRWTTEKKRADVQSISNWPVAFTPFPLTKQKRSPSFFDGSARLQYKPTNNVSLYLYYGHGTKTGSFADISGSPLEFKDEVAETYEAGVKLSFPDRLAALNLSVWRLDVSNYQDTYPINGAFVAENRNLYTQGVELQGNVSPIEGLSLNATLVYLDSHDQRGGDAVRAPTWNLTFGGRYQTALGAGLTGSIFSTYQYKDPYFNVPANDPARLSTREFSTKNWDLGVELRHDNGISAKLLGSNITNERNTAIATTSNYDPAVVVRSYNPLRQITLQLGYSF